MIVRRYDRATGAEAKPVSIKQAAWTDKPAEPGWWAWRYSPTSKPELIELDRYRIDNDKWIGQWAGPIVIAEPEPQKETSMKPLQDMLAHARFLWSWRNQSAAEPSIDAAVKSGRAQPAVLPDGLELLWGLQSKFGPKTWFKSAFGVVLSDDRAAVEDYRQNMDNGEKPGWEVRRMFPPEEPPKHPLLAAIDDLRLAHHFPLSGDERIALNLRALAEPVVAQNAEMRAMLKWVVETTLYGTHVNKIRELLARVEAV